MTFIEVEPFHHKTWNLMIYERLFFILLAQSHDDLKWRVASTIREGTWPFMKGPRSILLTQSHDDIY
jgi:hypothetical protein